VVTNECLRLEGGLGERYDGQYCSVDVEKCSVRRQVEGDNWTVE
jgi:hypothetical protein